MGAGEVDVEMGVGEGGSWERSCVVREGGSCVRREEVCGDLGFGRMIGGETERGGETVRTWRRLTEEDGEEERGDVGLRIEMGDVGAGEEIKGELGREAEDWARGEGGMSCETRGEPGTDAEEMERGERGDLFLRTGLKEKKKLITLPFIIFISL